MKEMEMLPINCNMCRHYEYVNETFFNTVKDETVRTKCVKTNACEGSMIPYKKGGGIMPYDTERKDEEEMDFDEEMDKDVEEIEDE